MPPAGLLRSIRRSPARRTVPNSRPDAQLLDLLARYLEARSCVPALHEPTRVSAKPGAGGRPHR